MTMDKSNKHEPQMTVRAANPTMETCPLTGAGRTVSELLEDTGNCRRIINQELNLRLLGDSLSSEQQKVSHVLDWAHSFLSSGSEVNHQSCRADSLILADEEQRERPAYMHPSAAKCHHTVSCTAGGNEVFGHFPDDPCIPFSFIPEREKYKETPENIKSMELQEAANKQTSSRDNRTSSLFISNQGQHTDLSDRNTNQTLASDGAACSIKKSTSPWSIVDKKVFGTARNLKLSYKTPAALSERDISGQKMELSDVNIEGMEETEDARIGKRRCKINEEQESSSAFAIHAKDNMNSIEPEKTQKPMEKTSHLGLGCHLKIPTTLTVYERYQLCVDQLHQLRERQSQHSVPGCSIESPAKERKTSVETAPQNPEIKEHLNKAGSKGVTATEITKKRSSDVINKKQDRSQYNRNRATLTEHGQTKHRDNLTMEERHAATCAERRSVCVINTTVEHLGPVDNVAAVEESAALTTIPGLSPERIGCSPGVEGYQSGVKGQKTKVGGQAASSRLCEKPSVSLSSPTNKEIFQRPQSSGVNKHTPEDKVKPTSAYRSTHKCLSPTETHTQPLHGDPGPTSSASGACRCKQTDNYNPAGVPVCDCWLCLPDEVWLSILSLLPHSDLCRVTRVCSRLHTLATDHTLWRNLRIANSDLTERCLLCVGRRRPHSLCLYSCSGLSLTSCGLQMFFTLCGNFLKEVKVTSCTGPGLHGDQMLRLIGQLCRHVTSVDVGWSGATDTGVKALSDCCPGLQLKSIVLNGCHVTDDPLMKLVMRHKESLCRLEVFGCQFLTPSCLQAVYEMCPGLQHLNIGQVPKVTAHCLTVMTSLLKCLISINLTGLQVVTDGTVETLLQNCVELQSLTFSSCPGVTDLTMYSISKYTPCIRSLDVSGCKAVTDAGVQSLALGCRRLQQLNLSSTGTGNRGVTLLANYCSRQLQTVKLNFCHITLETILKLCRRCKRLKALHLYGCARLPAEREIREVNPTVKVDPLP
ncbi:uncharacterized protein LOC116388393 [Anarrhichthys ocellatus]|uniref:uncharacterized protein LOC116388393 n=1 Tax=Anarrhichthys ocellatus TaxID=433405 RepID=UPI0012EE8507|nr:uncharacterized protein LOC116388393 [Anarrhichthys ocellatus]